MIPFPMSENSKKYRRIGSLQGICRNLSPKHKYSSESYASKWSTVRYFIVYSLDTNNTLNFYKLCYKSKNLPLMR